MCASEESKPEGKEEIIKKIVDLTEKERSLISKIQSSRDPSLCIERINRLLDRRQLQPRDISFLELLLEPREDD